MDEFFSFTQQCHDLLWLHGSMVVFLLVMCGMPAYGQAVGCGVCDTPELWRGAAGLCARVRACAGAADSLHTYIH